jgi:bifunctional DNA-binding transcriptional regulator/antitoxin component of YhaV-PrlF toxin-antitoxin module
MEQTFSRKLDTMGRIMIPIKLREQMQMIPGKEYTFSTLEKEGRKYICIDCGEAVSSKELENAIQLLEKSGLTVLPKE